MTDLKWKDLALTESSQILVFEGGNLLVFSTTFLTYAVKGSEVIHMYRIGSTMKRSVYTRNGAFHLMQTKTYSQIQGIML